jgi:hypothetical protein
VSIYPAKGRDETLSAAGKLITLKEVHHVPCIIFLKRKCAMSFSATENVLSRALALQKNVTTFFHTTPFLFSIENKK